jgi:type 1 glutamine amidotransferase
MTGRGFSIVAAAALALLPAAQGPRASAPPARPKHLLAWGDVRAGYQHDSISHAFATIERLGRESGLYDTWIRTDSQLITKHPIEFPAKTGIAKNPNAATPAAAANEPFLAHNLDFFDAVFFFGVREIDMTGQQKADLLSFVRDDGKGFVAAHSAITAFFSWPEFGEMIGGRFDEHPWGVTDATVVVDDPSFPAMKGFPRVSVRRDEHYQLKDFSRSAVRVLAHLDPGSLDLSRPLVHRRDGDFPVAWARMFGRGRVFYATLGHADATWDDPVVQQMYFGAIRWSLGLVDGDATPQPRRSPVR